MRVLMLSGTVTRTCAFSVLLHTYLVFVIWGDLGHTLRHCTVVAGFNTLAAHQQVRPIRCTAVKSYRSAAVSPKPATAPCTDGATESTLSLDPNSLFWRRSWRSSLHKCSSRGTFRLADCDLMSVK
ncbi:hypothetical protein F5B21DRAFT_178268 [Xylaria acuta]|nr:hypothetical protein F5B21DRAFT_178268 [Xylaria acuta]